MNIRQNRAKDIITRKAAEFISREASSQSLITVTDCFLSDDSKQATLLISVLPTEEERPAKSFVEHHLNELRAHIRENTRLKNIPYFAVEIDIGEKHRRKIEEIIAEDKKAEK